MTNAELILKLIEMLIESEKKQQAEEQSSRSSQGKSRMTQQEVLDRLHGLSTSGDLEDVVDDLM
jgi:hypothetical protein